MSRSRGDSAVLEELSSPVGAVEASRHPQAASLSGRRRFAWPVVTRRRLVVALGLLWILDGALQLQPSMYSRSADSFAGAVLQYNTMGAPNPLTDLIRFAVTLTYGTPTHQVISNTLAAVLQLAIGVALLSGRFERPALAASVAWAFMPWVVGEAFGQMPFPQSSMAFSGAPGAAALYMALSLALWPPQPDKAGDAGAVAEGGLIRGRGALGLWAVMWIGTGLLELEHSNWAPGAVAAQLRNLAGGEPRWIAETDTSVAHLVGGHGTAIALAMLLVQAWVGWGALRPLTRKVALGLGVGVSLFYWVLGQNFGAIFTGTGTDPSLGPVMVLFALALWPRVRVEVPAHPMGLQGWRPTWVVWMAVRWRRAAWMGFGTVLLGGALVGALRGIAASEAADRAVVAGEPSIGTQAPAGQFTTLSGATGNVTEFQHGRPELLWFIATWCESCQAETTTELSKIGLLGHRHVHVVELDLAGDLADLDRSATLSAMELFVRPYAHRSLGGTWTWGVASPALTRAYDPKGNLDQFYLIGGDGRIVARGENPTMAVP